MRLISDFVALVALLGTIYGVFLFGCVVSDTCRSGGLL